MGIVTDENGQPGASGPVVGPPYSAGGLAAPTGRVGLGEAQYGALGAALARLWADQQKFNVALSGLDARPRTVEELAQIYVLGMHSELDELLRRLNWKYHRRERKPPVDAKGLDDDLADLLKYVMCLFQLFGYDPLSAVLSGQAKTDVLWQVLGGEFKEPEPEQPILIVDLDNTVARYTDGLDSWMTRVYGHSPKDRATYDMAARYGLDRDFYNVWKLQWESGEHRGGYASLEPYPLWVAAVKEVAQYEDAFVVVSTARPAAEAKQVWYDCWRWATGHLLQVDRMLFTGRDRAAQAHAWRFQGHPVVALEDSPENIAAYYSGSIRTVVHKHPYNEGERTDARFVDDHPQGLVTHIRRLISEQQSED